MAFLVYACGRIVQPFIGVLLWSVILAIMLFPLHLRLMGRLGNRWSVTLIGLVGAALLIVPMFIAASAVADSVMHIAAGDVQMRLPPPPPTLDKVPLIGGKLTEAWALFSTNMPVALERYGAQLRVPAAWMAQTGSGMVVGVLSFLLSLIIASIVVAYGEGAAGFARALFARTTGDAERGLALVTLTVKTIRGVAQGVIGVAVIQAGLVGIGFFAVGLPGAGLLTLVTLVLGVAQVPAALVTLPAILFVFATEPTTTALIFAAWSTVAGLSDNVLKPLLLGRGLDVPMPVILIGVIGGLLADGLIGLFVGPVVLAVGYMLFVEWVRQPILPGR
jgi:predicted PurR-regulated permease PerM